MFGTVPKVLWNELNPADELNRISLRINPLLIQLEGKNILVETGFWDQGGEKFENMFGLDRDETVFRGLNDVGLAPADIDIVINTHLHFDHAGRNVTLTGEPTFANARYVVQKQELDDAQHPHARSRASYIAGYIDPVAAAGLFDVVEGEAEIVSGVKVVPLPGHNLGMQGVILESGGETLVYTADLVATTAHAPYPYVMGYDLYPVTCLEMSQKYLPKWFDDDALICTPHDPNTPFARLEETKKGFRLVAAE